MWSANENLFKDYGEDYKYDLFFSGVTRPEQTENLTRKNSFWICLVFPNTICLLILDHIEQTILEQYFPPEDYAKRLASSKICFITTGPADLVGTRYFEVMAGNRSLILMQ